MTDLSVIIVNYNVKDYLLNCLRSLEQRDDGVSVEVIVVDNHSADNSVEELEPLFPAVRWIALQDNLGFGRGNNEAIRYCNGRYILFLNPDTIVAHDTLNTMVRFMDANADVGMAGCKLLNADGTFQLACRRGFPTPWASFCKLFGLQAAFPKSPLFAKYNLTYKNVDETYAVDALIGAFMIGRTDVVRNLGGFDPAFFMYGEDLDLCYRVQQAGWKIMYVHSTSVVHFKGESTKRSSMNEVRVFYDAMEIFARKHFPNSRSFLVLMRAGIALRSFVEQIIRKRVEIAIALADMVFVLGSLLLATAIRFDSPFGFPDYAYPTVLIVVPLVALLSLIVMGEYVEYRPTVRRSLVGLLVAFLVLSSLMQFFKEFNFSRGVLLMTIGSAAIFYSLLRGTLAIRDIQRRRRRRRRVLLVGLTEGTASLISAMMMTEPGNTTIVGVVATEPAVGDDFAGFPILGSTQYIDKIILASNAQEIIVTDAKLSKSETIRLMKAGATARARVHIAEEYDTLVTSRIIAAVAGTGTSVQLTPLLRFRNRSAKRITDVVISLLVLLSNLPLLTLSTKKTLDRMRSWAAVLR
ncbi:MAG: glycosyltransferase, partial [bacterium]|nr:glycosyltransferase [bacterium]